MIDRVKGFTIVLSEDIRIDEIEDIKNALTMVKGVQSVLPVIVEGFEYITEQKVKNEIRNDLFEFINERI